MRLRPAKKESGNPRRTALETLVNRESFFGGIAPLDAMCQPLSASIEPLRSSWGKFDHCRERAGRVRIRRKWSGPGEIPLPPLQARELPKLKKNKYGMDHRRGPGSQADMTKNGTLSESAVFLENGNVTLSGVPA